MGLESKNFLFVFNKEKAIENITEAIHFEDVFHKDGQTLLIRKGDDYWIDLLSFSDKTKELSIRIALCNPEQAFTRELKTLLEELFALSEGSFLLDRDSKAKYYYLDSVSWEAILNSYKERKEVFVSRYGEIEMPISADDFYNQLNKQ